MPPSRATSARNSPSGRSKMIGRLDGSVGPRRPETMRQAGPGREPADSRRATSNATSAPMLCPKNAYGRSRYGSRAAHSGSSRSARRRYGCSPSRVSRPGSWIGRTSTSGANSRHHGRKNAGPPPACGKQKSRSGALAAPVFPVPPIHRLSIVDTSILTRPGWSAPPGRRPVRAGGEAHRPDRSRAARSGVCRAVHAVAQAARPHVRPHLGGVGRALLLGALLPDLVPPGGYLVAGQPERVLVLVVAEHLVPRVVVHVTVPFVRSWLLLRSLLGHRGLP